MSPPFLLSLPLFVQEHILWLCFPLEKGKSIHPLPLRVNAPWLVQCRRRSWIGQPFLFKILGTPQACYFLRLPIVPILCLPKIGSSLGSLDLQVLHKSQTQMSYRISRSSEDLEIQLPYFLILLLGKSEVGLMGQTSSLLMMTLLVVQNVLAS